MWIVIGIISVTFLFLLRKGYIKQLLITAIAIGAIVFSASFYYFHISLSFSAFNAVSSIFIWYLILVTLYKIVKRK